MHKPRFAFDYDADSQTIAFDLGVFGLQDTTDLAQATWFAFPDAGYSGTGASFQLERNVFALGSYVAKNAFGASRKIAKSREIISLLNDEGVSERRNARVKLDKFTPSMAKLTGEAMRTALVVDMQDATAFHTRGDSSIPTMLNPRDVNSYYYVLSAKVKCGLLIADDVAFAFSLDALHD